jgi:hypothetical protein
VRERKIPKPGGSGKVRRLYTSHRIKPYAIDILGGDPGVPFRWIPERRAQLTAELDAAMLHLYDLDRDDAEDGDRPQ